MGDSSWTAIQRNHRATPSRSLDAQIAKAAAKIEHAAENVRRRKHLERVQGIFANSRLALKLRFEEIDAAVLRHCVLVVSDRAYKPNGTKLRGARRARSAADGRPTRTNRKDFPYSGRQRSATIEFARSIKRGEVMGEITTVGLDLAKRWCSCLRRIEQARRCCGGR